MNKNTEDSIFLLNIILMEIFHISLKKEMTSSQFSKKPTLKKN